jgi:hypothetical protein
MYMVIGDGDGGDGGNGDEGDDDCGDHTEYEIGK